MQLLRFAAALSSFFLLTLAGAEEKTVTWTGWFSDQQCASARASSGAFTATNPDCARACIEKGVAPAFISEQAKAVYLVKGYDHVIDDLGYHVEIQGAVDEAAKTVAIRKVTRLEYQGASCARPRKVQFLP